MRRRAFLLAATSAAVLPAGCAGDDSGVAPNIVGSQSKPVTVTDPPRATEEPAENADNDPDEGPAEDTAADLDPADYNVEPQEWGERVTGVRTRLDTGDQVVALTFDACGGSNGVGYDQELIDFLVAEEVPATLFLNARWIDANEDVVLGLSAEPFFELANHGTEHRPLSVTGASAYGLTGTADAAGVIDEVLVNQERMTALTGSPPTHFRSGTAHYDDVAVRITTDLGLQVAGYEALGDAGATFTSAQVESAVSGATAGSIVLLHMNHPGSGTAAGVRQAIPALRARGLEFARLSDYPLA